MSDPKNEIIITEYNYEEYFMLYADGELTEAQMASVDAFISRHPKFEHELQALFDLKLPADNIPVFSLKDKLLKPLAWDEENPGAGPSWLLNTLDGEDAGDRPEALSDAEMERELSLLARTQLPDEKISMPQKFRLLHLAEWDAENLTADQQSWLEALENGQEVPPGIVGDPLKMAEWHKLKQSVLPPEVVAMANKEILYQLMSWDAEQLTPEQEALLEAFEAQGALPEFIASNPLLMAEWAMLQATRLPAEAVAMPGKAGLYRGLDQWDADHLTAAQLSLLEALDAQAPMPAGSPATEWSLLQQTVLPRENMPMPNKASLYRGAAALWDAENLSDEQVAQLEALHAGAPAPAGVSEEEWELLQQTVLPAEVVEMPNKDSLYREVDERPLAPVISLPWRKIAAAAATLLAFAWLGIQVFNSNSETAIASQQAPAVIVPGLEAEDLQDNAVQPANEDADRMTAQTGASAQQPEMDTQAGQNNSAPGNAAPAQNSRALIASANDASQAVRAARNREQFNTVVPVAYDNSTERQVSGDFRRASQRVYIQTKQSPGNTQALSDLENGVPRVNAAPPTEAFIIPDLEEDSEDRYININGVRIEKQKLRTVIRPITRRLNRTFQASEVAPADEGTRLLR